jgi:hypothetical protein
MRRRSVRRSVRSPLCIGLGAALLFATYSAAASAQAAKDAQAQAFGRIAVTLGMTEAEAIRRLREDFDVRPLVGAEDTFLVRSKGTPEDIVGSFFTKGGRIANITSEWTPRTDSGGAIGEVLFTLLARLSAVGSQSAAWRTADGCTVNTADGLTAGRDSQIRIAEIVCSNQKVVLSVSRRDGGASQIQLQFTTQ